MTNRIITSTFSRRDKGMNNSSTGTHHFFKHDKWKVHILATLRLCRQARKLYMSSKAEGCKPSRKPCIWHEFRCLRFTISKMHVHL